MVAANDSLQARLLLQMPAALPVRYFLVWSFVPTLVAFFMTSFLRDDGPRTLIDALAPFLLTLFVVMAFRVSEIIHYECFFVFLDTVPELPEPISAYLRAELAVLRAVSYICLCNGITALLLYCLIAFFELQSPLVVGGAILLVLASFVVFCANHVALGSTRRYIDSLAGMEYLPERTSHAH